MRNTLIILRALANKTRLEIIGELLEGEKCVCEIFPRVKKSQANVSIHLNKLKEIKILSSRREGKKIFYRIANPKIIKALNELGYKN